MRKSLGLFLLFILLAADGLFGQEFRGRIQGTVTDPTQAVIAGATVTLKNIDTGVTATRQTNETGVFIFDLVSPGNYTVTVEMQGFNKFVQEKFPLQQRGDVTVNATLRAGDIKESVTVTAEAATVQFNTSKLETTVDSKLTNNLPQYYRTPFLLAQLDPAVEKNDYNSEYMPYHSWGANQQRVGGGANFTNDLQVDGSPVGIGRKAGYVPSPDMVQEVNVQQNAVDAEYGNSSGSAISLTLKSGTNSWHGTAFYQGQYPWANALENRVVRTTNLSRNHMYGGTVGHPIIKNKLFNFVAYEGWEKTDPSIVRQTLPTDLERQGDFSQSIAGRGGVRTIYDPWTTQTSPDGATITRTPFPGNRIPTSRQDPISVSYMGKLWKSNSPGTGPYNLNNFNIPLPIKFPYKNFSDRVDYQASDKLRISGRVSIFKTPVSTSNPTGSELFLSDRGSQRDGTSYTGDMTYTLSANTILNVRGSYHNFVDASKFASTYGEGGGWAKVWPNSNFYKDTFADPGIPILIPRMSVTGTDNSTRLVNMGPGGGYWDQRPTGDSFDFKIAQQRGKHYLKFGFDTRGSRAPSLLQLANPGFGFDSNPTNSTYVNPDTLASGDGYATFLLGAVVPTASGGASDWDSRATSMSVLVLPTYTSRTFSGFINDDWKITRNLTLNLGLRYEFEIPFREEQDRLTRPLDLTNPIPELQGASGPQMPAAVKQFYSGSWIFNGAFNFTENNNRNQWQAGSGTWSPRVGAAYRINDKTSFRAAYGRYMTPWNRTNAYGGGGGGTHLLEGLTYGFNNYTGAQPMVQGVPQMYLKDPFPASYPVIPANKKSLGRYTGLGDSFAFILDDRPRMRSDRFNFSFQREIPTGAVLDVTYFLNLTDFAFDTVRDLNMIDPRIAYQYKDATNQQVANPFYQLLPVTKFPGPLRNQRTVGITSLMKPYPQYGSINVTDGQPGGNMKYHSIQFKLQRTFSKGYALLVGYNYHYQKDERFYDNIAQYLQQYTVYNSENPRHRLTAAGTWEIPFGKGRSYMSNAPRIVDGILGGWDLTPTLFWRSGRYPIFGGMLANGDPRIDNPGPTAWFNTSVFQRLPNYTARTNPRLYDGLTGPGQFNMDMSLVKGFHITETIRFELRLDTFNTLNNMTWADPDVNIQSPNFGRSANNDQLANTFGRRAQLGLRIEF